jgi:hypothetical protein
MAHQTPNETIEENMEQPKIGKNNMGEFEQHSLKDQIAAAKYLNASKAGANKFKGMIIQSFGLPGTM